MKRELVSVVIPVYNTERFLKKCIQSVTEQSYPFLEILVIDDGSTDGSPRLLQELEEADKRIRVIRQRNAGVAAARNKGIELASGKYITFVDSDDHISPDYVKRFVRCMRETGTQMAVCGVQYTDDRDRILKRIIPGEYVRFEKEEWPMRISAVWSHFYLKRLWDESGLRFVPGERGEDMPVALYFAAMCEQIATVHSCGYYYVQHGESAMTKFRGLRNYNLPYEGLSGVFRRIQATGAGNSERFYELFALRIFATCVFDLARGAEADKKRELCGFVENSLHNYFPDYWNNPYIMPRGWKETDFPLPQKIAVTLLAVCVKYKLLNMLVRFL